MILYKNSLKGFQNDVDTNQIGDLVERSFQEKLGRKVAPNEKRSWVNSMAFMERAVRHADLSESCGVLLEYMIPSTSNRIDFLITGEDESGNKNFVIVELKQWENAESTDRDGVVSTYVGGGVRNTTHPSYQAYSYKLFLKDYNENIDSGALVPFSCAYLHNYKQQNPEPLMAPIYESVIADTPLYFKDDQEKLEKFLHQHVRFGKGEEILYSIEAGKIKPSKKLIDHVTEMFEGNNNFILLDEQKVAYETARTIAKRQEGKSVVIIKGGPGTGKSVISMNLLGGLLKDGLHAIFVAPNAAFREVMVRRLTKTQKKTRLSNLFKGSGNFVDTETNTFDAIIVDEAHRLKKAGAYMYMGENQVEDVINASRTSIFFVDDYQMIRPDDIGSAAEIKRVAKAQKASVTEIELVAQFRCAGAEGYLNWLDHTLQIRDTANFDGWDQKDFEFRIFSNPNDLRKTILRKHEEGFNARILAGYAWRWSGLSEGNKNAEVADVEIAEYNFRMPWNSRQVGSTWAIDPSGIHQAGCIHTSQGLEFDYVGVIVGSDLKFDPSVFEYSADWEQYKDTTGKKGLKENPEELTKLVKNIYKVLMSRGMKGCYVYFVDKNTEQFFSDRSK